MNTSKTNKDYFIIYSTKIGLYFDQNPNKFGIESEIIPTDLKSLIQILTKSRRFQNSGHKHVKFCNIWMDFLQATDVPLPRGVGVDWSLYHEESPKNNPIFSHALMMELFNHTATFRSDCLVLSWEGKKKKFTSVKGWKESFLLHSRLVDLLITDWSHLLYLIFVQILVHKLEGIILFLQVKPKVVFFGYDPHGFLVILHFYVKQQVLVAMQIRFQSIQNAPK